MNQVQLLISVQDFSNSVFLAVLLKATATFPSVTLLQEHHKPMALCQANCYSQKSTGKLVYLYYNMYFAYHYFTVDLKIPSSGLVFHKEKCFYYWKTYSLD